MVEDAPEIGLVIRHVYLWRDEQLQGRDEGRKARPCVIVHKRENEYGEIEVFICPVTHTPPRDLSAAKEIPLKTKQRLNLDEVRSWIITSEVNRFTWKGPDVQQTETGAMAYGFLPHNFTSATIEQFRGRARQRAVKVIDRDDPALLERERLLRQKRQSKPGRGRDKKR